MAYHPPFQVNHSAAVRFFLVHGNWRVLACSSALESFLQTGRKNRKVCREDFQPSMSCFLPSRREQGSALNEGMSGNGPLPRPFRPIPGAEVLIYVLTSTASLQPPYDGFFMAVAGSHTHLRGFLNFKGEALPRSGRHSEHQKESMRDHSFLS